MIYSIIVIGRFQLNKTSESWLEYARTVLFISDGASTFSLDISSFDYYGLEPALAGVWERKTGSWTDSYENNYNNAVYWEGTSNTFQGNTIVAFPSVNADGDLTWSLTHKGLGAAGTFIGMSRTDGLECPCQELEYAKLWYGFWDEVGMAWRSRKPRESNEFIFTSVSIVPIVTLPPTTTTTTTPTIGEISEKCEMEHRFF